MPDFSHLKRLPLSSFLPGLDPRGQQSPWFFDHLLDRIEPPLFGEPRWSALRAELCWFARKPYSTRPPKGLSRSALAAQVRQLERPDVPQVLLDCLAIELDRKPPKNRLAAPIRELNHRQRSRRESTIRAVHAEFVRYVRDGTEPCIPLLAERARQLDGSKTPMSAAIRLTHDVIRDDFKMYPPDVGRIRNIVGNYHGKRAAGT